MYTDGILIQFLFHILSALIHKYDDVFLYGYYSAKGEV